MIRLNITAEGQTEQAFVKRILAPHLSLFNVHAFARSVLTSREPRTHREFRGGLNDYVKPKADIIAWMKQEPSRDVRFSTMFDLYGLPNDFPGFATAHALEPYARVARLEQALSQDIGSDRFIPYIQLHEFETLILADPAQLGIEYLEHSDGIKRLAAMVDNQNPELINGGTTTAPSKRIRAQIPDYKKSTAGVSVLERIGLPTLRAKCAHFDAWLTRLEDLGKTV